MPDQFRIEVDDEQLLKMLSRAQAEAQDLTPLMEDIEGIMVDAAERAFKNEQDPETGAPWAALSPTTQNKEVAAGKLRGAKPILQVSSSLVQSIGGRHDASSAEAGVAEKYGITHQLGAKKGEYVFADGAYTFDGESLRPRKIPIPWGDIPARPFLGIGEDDRNEILDAVSQYISNAFQ